MSRTLPPLNALRAFEAAGRHQSFSRAAEELGVSHSSISRHIRGLEDRLNRQLFRDQARGVVLSREGAAYLAEITPALDAISEATGRLVERAEGVINVNSEPLFATKWVIPRLVEFQRAHPQIDVRLEASRGLADIERYEADMAIRFLSVAGSNPDAILISDAPLYPYAAPGLVDLPLASPTGLLEYPLLRDRTSGTWGYWFDLAGHPVDPTRVPGAGWRMRSPLAFEAALAGHGVLLTSADVTAHDVAAGRLARLSDVGFREGGYYLVLGEGVLRRKPVRLFKEWLLARSKGLRGQPV
ncbi:Glycine cleavage system transcriptional activator [Roseobacter fucihabitans]|uniref:Glycine cleavage system transcriptional activator n=1 Tax=Roseobacter fucihabitans TaxID=1537242 RepID=A0ABZ2BX10_9RHOB|nr:LysR substrate-binding domain-containing protein [Roseobacter litoralis]MBC6966307.1 Glycine cleavage system transcriptional activator [Roseobacter litoralis]